MRTACLLWRHRRACAALNTTDSWLKGARGVSKRFAGAACDLVMPAPPAAPAEGGAGKVVEGGPAIASRDGRSFAAALKDLHQAKGPNTAKERLRALMKLISTPGQARQALVAAAATAALRSKIRPRKVAHAKGALRVGALDVVASVCLNSGELALVPRTSHLLAAVVALCERAGAAGELDLIAMLHQAALAREAWSGPVLKEAVVLAYWRAGEARMARAAAAQLGLLGASGPRTGVVNLLLAQADSWKFGGAVSRESAAEALEAARARAKIRASAGRRPRRSGPEAERTSSPARRAKRADARRRAPGAAPAGAGAAGAARADAMEQEPAERAALLWSARRDPAAARPRPPAAAPPLDAQPSAAAAERAGRRHSDAGATGSGAHGAGAAQPAALAPAGDAGDRDAAAQWAEALWVARNPDGAAGSGARAEAQAGGGAAWRPPAGPVPPSGAREPSDGAAQVAAEALGAAGGRLRHRLAQQQAEATGALLSAEERDLDDDLDDWGAGMRARTVRMGAASLALGRPEAKEAGAVGPPPAAPSQVHARIIAPEVRGRTGRLRPPAGGVGRDGGRMDKPGERPAPAPAAAPVCAAGAASMAGGAGAAAEGSTPVTAKCTAAPAHTASATGRDGGAAGVAEVPPAPEAADSAAAPLRAARAAGTGGSEGAAGGRPSPAAARRARVRLRSAHEAETG